MKKNNKIKKSKYHGIKLTSCPICCQDTPKDLLKFLEHLEINHYPKFKILDGHFLFYEDEKILNKDIRNALEHICVKLLFFQSDKLLKGKRGKYISKIEKCSKCHISKSTLIRYSIDGKYQFLLCKPCKDSLFKTENYIKIIYNPTEQGKR